MQLRLARDLVTVKANSSTLHPATQGLLRSVDPAVRALRRAIDCGHAAKEGPNWTAQPAPPPSPRSPLRRRHDREAVVTRGTTAAAAVLAFWRNSSCPRCPPARLHLVRRIKFTNFDCLLGPGNEEGWGAHQLQGKREDKKKASKRCVGDFASWMEAWNVYLAIRSSPLGATAHQLPGHNYTAFFFIPSDRVHKI